MIFTRPQKPNQLPDRVSFKHCYPDFSETITYDGLPYNSKVHNVKLRSNLYIIRPYSPAGFTEAGLYIALNELWARVWGFVLACTVNNNLNLCLGDLILFERWREKLLDYDDPMDPQFAGEKQPIALLHERDIIAKIEDNTLSVPV